MNVVAVKTGVGNASFEAGLRPNAYSAKLLMPSRSGSPAFPPVAAGLLVSHEEKSVFDTVMSKYGP